MLFVSLSCWRVAEAYRTGFSCLDQLPPAPRPPLVFCFLGRGTVAWRRRGRRPDPAKPWLAALYCGAPVSKMGMRREGVSEHSVICSCSLCLAAIAKKSMYLLLSPTSHTGRLYP